MKSWNMSLQGALALAFAHLTVELWRAFLDFAYVLPDFSGESIPQMAIYALIYTSVFMVWLLGLSNARSGRRGGLITAILLGALFWAGVDWGTIFFYCPGGCDHIVFDVVTWVGILAGAASLVGLITVYRRTQVDVSQTEAAV